MVQSVINFFLSKEARSMQPNVPIQYSTLAEYIEALAGSKVTALSQNVDASFNNVMGLISDLQTAVADIESLNANISANADVVANTAHRLTVAGNPHRVTKIEVGLSQVPNYDFTAEMQINNAKVGITPEQAAAIVANTAKVGITPEQTDDIVAANVHRLTVTGNPHQVTKTDVGLGNVPNVDTTNASNITSGVLPTSVLPPLAITDTYNVANEAEQLALVVQKGDIAVRADISRSFINQTGGNSAMSDWQELMTPTDLVLSVNGYDGVIQLVTSDIPEGTNLYYTEERVSANVDVALNTANRHTHGNKAVLDATTEPFTVERSNELTLDTEHRNTIVGNPHQVTKADVGLSNVPNHDFTAEVAANTAKVGITPEQAADIVAANVHRTTTSGNPHNVTKTEVGLSNVPNTDFTADVLAANNHRTTVTGNPHQVTKADVGLGNVPNYDFTAEMEANNAKVGITPEQAAAIVANTAKVGITPEQAASIVSADTHIATVTGNPHQVTKAEVGLGNVPNVDTTNASNITTGVLPSNVLPPIAITDTFVVATEAEQLALVVEKGDVVVRTDLGRSFINQTGDNTTMSDWQELQTPTDTILSVNGQTGSVVLTTTNIAEGTNLYYTEERVSANVDVAANTANRHSHANKAVLDATNESFTTAILNEHLINNAKVGITPEQAAAIVANTAKVGITTEQAADIVAANTHRATVTGNPHQVTKAEVGLSLVPNHDFTDEVNANTAHRVTVTGNPHQVTKAEVGLGNVPNTDFTNDVALANAHIATVAGNPHHVTKEEVGLGLVPNHDFTAEVAANTAKVGITPEQAADIVAANDHRAIISGNPHNVTKAEVGLGNVQNIDTTNASNIITGILPSSVLPPIAITDTFTVANEAEQLALTVQRGDIVVRTDVNRSYINKLGANSSMEDWQELLTPTDTILSVNGQTGVVTLTTTHINEGSNLYYTEDRVANNYAVAINTANRHTHGNKAILDATTDSFTTQRAAEIDLNNAHRLTISGNPHQVTKVEVGLGNVPNYDFTAEMLINNAKVGITPEQAASIVSADAHRATVTGNPHQVTKAEVGLGNVPNVDFSTEVAAANAHIATVAGNPHQVTKAEVGLGNVPNYDFTAEMQINNAKVGITPEQAEAIIINSAKVGITVQQAADIVAANDHRAIISGNPHQVTKAEVGLGNVPNVDTTNASNITTGTLPTSVLPQLAITDTFVVATEAEQLAVVAQKGDVAVRTDLGRSYINVTGNNATMDDWQELLTPTDTILSINGQTGAVVLTTTNIAEGTNLYYTEERVSANVDVALNTANRHNHANKSILDATTDSFTVELKNNIVANNAKVGITPEQAAAIVANTAKVGITPEQAASIVAADIHRSTVVGNPHNVTKTEVGLSQVPNHDFTTEVNANTDHRGIITGNPHQVTKAEVGLGDVPNHDFTTEMLAVTTHMNTVEGNPHHVTKAEVGLGNVPNYDFTAEMVANNAKVGITPEQAASIVAADVHRAIVAGNPHHVTKEEIGLGNVPNVDTTNASNITTGTLPSSVLPSLAITDTYVVATELEQLALTVDKGDIAVRTDLNRSYINMTGVNNAMSDWQELNTPTDIILSVNGQTGTVVLTTSNIAEGTNLYYTEERVSANVDVAANTANRHNHSNKTILDAITAPYTTNDADTLAAANAHRLTTSGNPHQVTKAEVGLSEVPNTNFTGDVAAANAHIATVTGNPHQVTKAEVGLGNVPNHDFTAEVAANTAKVGITPEQAAAIEINSAKVGITPEQTADIISANTHRNTVSGNPHNVTKAEVGLGNVPNYDFTAEMAINNAKVGITPQQAADIVEANDHRAILSGNPHMVTKAEVGLGNVPNTNFTTDVAAANAHIATVAGNPHQVTKAEVGLGNVPNVDTTNASNITSGILPSSVLPAIAITDTFVVESEVAQLALTVQKGDVAVRTDLGRSFINQTGNNGVMSDWQELLTPTDTILSINGQTGAVVLTTTNIDEGTNLYYTEERVSANVDVAANTANRHSHANKAVLDATNESFTSQLLAEHNANNAKVGITIQQAADIETANAHVATVAGNPHMVTKAEVGLSNVPNVDFSSAIAANTAHVNTVTGNPHNVTKAEVGLGNVPNTDFTADVATAMAHVGTTSGNPHRVTKAEVGLSEVPNHDFTAEVAANTAKVGITTEQAADIVAANAHRLTTSGNPHAVTKADVGLGLVPNHDFTAEVNENTVARHTHANKPVLDATTAAFTPAQADEIIAATLHRNDRDTNPHGITPIMIGAETPAGAQIKADTAEHNANLYTDSFILQSPNALLFEAAFRNSLSLDKGVGVANFTRETNANHLDRYGIVRKSEINEPRFDRHGLLIEGESTNYFPTSKDAYIFDKTNCRIELNKQYDASFEATVDVVTIDVPQMAWRLEKTITDMYLVKDGYVTFSVRLKSLNSCSVELKIRDSAGMNEGDFGGTKVLVLNDKLTRYDFTVFVANATTGHPVVIIEGLTLTEGAQFSLVDMQVEPLNFASSVIETTGTPVTRAADRMSIPYVENFPGSLAAKTIAMDVNVIGTTDSIPRCFVSGDLQMYIGNGTPGNRMTKVGMAAGAETEWVEKIGKFRFGVVYDPTTKVLAMYHDGVKVAFKAGVDTADPPLANTASYDQFLAEVYPGLDPANYSVAILQIPLDILQSEIRFDSGTPFMSISNIRIVDEALTDKQMLSF
jgi:uncharacterized protein YpmB